MFIKNKDDRVRRKKRDSFKKKMGKKKCRFCVEKLDIDYKDANLLRGFVSDRGKILNSRITGVCAKHQRKVSQAIKRARIIAFLPFTNI